MSRPTGVGDPGAERRGVLHLDARVGHVRQLRQHESGLLTNVKSNRKSPFVGRNHPAWRFSPVITKSAISSERLTPRFLANASVLCSRSCSSEMLIFLAPLPTLGRPRPRRRFRSWAYWAAVIGLALSNTKGWSNRPVARAN